MQKGKLGQSATEYLMIFGLVIIIVGIAYIYSSNILGNSNEDSKARTSVNEIANTVNKMAGLAPGTRMELEVDFPSEITQVILDEKLVGIVVNVNGANSHYYADLDANLGGTIPLSSGPHNLVFLINEEGKIIVEPA